MNRQYQAPILKQAIKLKQLSLSEENIRFRKSARNETVPKAVKKVRDLKQNLFSQKKLTGSMFRCFWGNQKFWLKLSSLKR
jgi:hypothetical protein